MPNETQAAIDWALSQTFETVGDILPVTKNTPHELVDKVREYFNKNGIIYETFSYGDLEPFLN